MPEPKALTTILPAIAGALILGAIIEHKAKRLARGEAGFTVGA